MVYQVIFRLRQDYWTENTRTLFKNSILWAGGFGAPTPEGDLKFTNITIDGTEVYPTANPISAIPGNPVNVDITFNNIGVMDDFMWEARDQYETLLASGEFFALSPDTPAYGNFSFTMLSEDVSLNFYNYHSE